MKPAPFIDNMSAFTARAIEKLKSGKPGDTLTRSEMAEVIGRDASAGSNGEANVRAAIKHVIKNHRIVWKWDRQIGAWKCLNDSEKVTATESQIVGARRKIRNGLRIATAIDTANLTPEEAQGHRMQCTVMQTSLLFTDQATRRKIEAKTNGHAALPSPEKLAEIFK